MLMVSVALLLAGRQFSYPAYSVKPLSGVTIPGLPAVTSHICVNQFGYLSDATKVAVISDPVQGYNAFDHYTPGSQLELRNKAGKVMTSGPLVQWNNGSVHSDSGDRGWWFDFSGVSAPGQYYVYDPSTHLRSALFRIGSGVYDGVLRGACRMFYFQRLGVPITAKYAEGPWVDGPGCAEDARARNVLNKDSVEEERDMSGGWMDAGDTDKYPPFDIDSICGLLYSYRANPKAFQADFNIPESGNGLPDILNELKFQLDCLERMQFPDGSVPVKMGNIDYNAKVPLSADHRIRYYGPKDSGATIATCANFALAARVFGKFPQGKAYAEDLQQRAIRAWRWFNNHPHTYKSDTGEIKSGIANRTEDEQSRLEAYAAIQLFALTGDEQYQEAIREHVGASRQLAEGLWSPYEECSSEALCDYTTMPKADPAIVERIRRQLRQSAMDPHFAPAPDADLYRAWMEPSNYHWGSCQPRAGWGIVAILAADYGGVDAATKKRLYERAADMLHSFHGVNPLSVAYLTNMSRYGAEHSLTSMYHSRYGFGSPFTKNPPPGYITGGPNQSFDGKAAEGNPSIDWIKQQPRGKAYADFCLAWPESSWEITEPDLGYQAQYVRLLAAFVK